MNQDDERKLIELAAQSYDDPALFVKYAFPWGSGDLKDYDGLDVWQEEFIRDLAKGMMEGLATNVPVRMAVASGHGIGKSALISIIILWFMATRKNARIRVTAVNEAQLRSVTWAELALWHSRCIFKHWFQWEATRFSAIGEDRAVWFAEASTWNENKPDGIAGLHGDNCMLIFDEASGIPQSIWEACLGVFTKPGNAHVVFGNPIHPSGGFYDCFHHPAISEMWKTRNINSLDTKFGNVPALQQIYDAYGADHDTTRRRVLGQFPLAAASQFISTYDVDQAFERHLEYVDYADYPMFIGVDVARYGDDKSVIVGRQGPKLLFMETFDGHDTYQLTDVLLGYLRKHPECMAAYIDEIGVGAGVLDRALRYDERVVGVNVSRRPSNVKLYQNLRVDLWDRGRDWIKTADIPPNDILKQELISIEYDFNDKGQMRLEAKERMKKRGVPSPDHADAIMLTFAHTHELDMMPGELDFAATQTYERNYSGRSRTTGY